MKEKEQDKFFFISIETLTKKKKSSLLYDI